MSLRCWAWLAAYCLGLGGPSVAMLAGNVLGGGALLVACSGGLLLGLYTTKSAPQARGRS